MKSNTSGDHADEFYFEDSGLRLWEKRHFIVGQILINNKFSKVFHKNMMIIMNPLFKVADFGCNDGKFIRRLTNDPSFSLLVQKIFFFSC